jgi:hypothetical protein
LSAQYPRYGYRRIAIFLARDGHRMSFGRAHRLWRLARLQVRGNARANGSRRGGRAVMRRQEPTRCGVTISCSTPARTASS